MIRYRIKQVYSIKNGYRYYIQKRYNIKDELNRIGLLAFYLIIIFNIGLFFWWDSLSFTRRKQINKHGCYLDELTTVHYFRNEDKARKKVHFLNVKNFLEKEKSKVKKSREKERTKIIKLARKENTKIIKL